MTETEALKQRIEQLERRMGELEAELVKVESYQPPQEVAGTGDVKVVPLVDGRTHERRR